ncbi:ribbon-helix-helix domain-containing protein [Lacrimispora sp. BS-2]|uniref:Ribbon-helix-helix domain-containing protein n=1 Tax=Lacrimispora sp. BS-2 TaxID=3151850 RepID=A0AAU7PSP7_9FIRM
MRKTEKITVSLPSDTVKLADEAYAGLGFSNRLELINAAIREYVTHDLMRQFTGELTEIYQKIERSEIKELEQHLSKLSYKIAVELAQIYMLLATAVELPYDVDRSLRGKAVKQVNHLKGFVPLSKAVKEAEKLEELL